MRTVFLFLLRTPRLFPRRMSNWEASKYDNAPVT